MGRRVVAAIARTAAVIAVCGCGEPASDVIAVWIDEQTDEDGNRALRIYDAGERRRLTFEPTIPGTDPELLQMTVDRRGRGVVLSGRSRSTFVELDAEGGRVGVLDTSLADDPAAILAPDFSILRNADAVVREIEEPPITVAGELQRRPRRVALLPTRASFGLRQLLLEAPGVDMSDTGGTSWALASASNAPVVVWTEVRGSPLHPEGTIVALAYPGESGPGAGIAAPLELGRGIITGRPIEDTTGPGRVPAVHCRHRLCVSPSGDTVYTMTGQPCTLWRWSWRDAAAPGDPVEPRRVALPGGCPTGRDPWLVAAIDDDRVVLDDEDRYYLFDLRAEVMQAVPKLGRGLSRVEVRDRGHVLVHISHEGEMLRIDGDGPRLVSAERGVCSIADDIAVSPRGNWAIVACSAFGGDLRADASGGTLMRVSALGLEQLTGIAMRPLAIDDEGNALLFSYDRDAVQASPVPRGLFVLSGDGQLSRIDELEPAPAQVALWNEQFGRVLGRFAAAARP